MLSSLLSIGLMFPAANTTARMLVKSLGISSHAKSWRCPVSIQAGLSRAAPETFHSRRGVRRTVFWHIPLAIHRCARGKMRSSTTSPRLVFRP